MSTSLLFRTSKSRRPSRNSAAMSVDTYSLQPETPVEAIKLEDWLKCWSALDGKIRFVIDAERALLCADRSARSELKLGGALRLSNQRVEPADSADLPAFERLLAQSKWGTETLCLRRQNGDGHVLIQAMSVGNQQGNAIIGITVRSADSSFKPLWVDLDKTFHLTPAEDHVVKLLLGGLNAEEIARTNYLSIDTIRTHIRHAYDKLYVSSREQLWRKLAAYRLN